MKKLILLTLICSMLLAVAVACDIPDKDISDETQTYICIDHAYAPEDSCGLTDTTETSSTPETTETTETTYGTDFGMETIMRYTVNVMTDGVEYKPYTSTVYFQNHMMVGDGILMFVSLENQLPHWIAEGVIPHIELNEDSEMKFTCDEEASIRHSGKFRMFTQNEDGTVSERAAFEQSTIAEVYAYGTEHFMGETVYISFPFIVETKTDDGKYFAVHDIMCLVQTTFEDTDPSDSDTNDTTDFGIELIMDYSVSLITDHVKTSPYASTVYFRFGDMISDGILMFIPLETQLPRWIEEGVIPYVKLDETSTLEITCGEGASIRHSGRFRILMQKSDGTVEEKAVFEKSTIAEVYAYGTEHFAGETVYISFPFIVEAQSADGEFYADHDIVCLVKTTF